MKAFLACTALFLLLTVLVTTFAFLSAAKVEEIEKMAEKAAACSLSEQDEEAKLLFDSLKKEWNALQPKLLVSIHHSTVKPVRLAMTDAQNAITLEDRASLYTALVRLSTELKALADDIRIPAL